MKFLYIFYNIKPLLPRAAQVACRRVIAAYKKRAFFDVWPIDPDSGEAPKGWTGWPDSRKFAFILTHDVDSKKGYDRALRLMELEDKLGFKSSFNFVPEGYPVSRDILKVIRRRGFDVGVHGLTHDGRLYINYERFMRCVPKINKYLEEWEAAGFHSPSMLSNLEWITELNAEYDCSSFDTDPFEPINYSVRTIFPFILIDRRRARVCVELPYTLPQDHGLFVILREKDISIWKKKTDWIAEKGGMVFLNTHPDYMNFGGSSIRDEEYPVSFYIDFLEYVRNRYGSSYWHVLPRELAKRWRVSISNAKKLGVDIILPRPRRPPDNLRKTIWIDLDNSPHVPFFKPIIARLEGKGYRVLLTARDNSQTCELADFHSLNYLRVGKHYGKNKIIKIWTTVIRALLLSFIMRNKKIRLAVSHGSRSQTLAAKLLRMPTLGISDYEFTAGLGGPKWVLNPEVLGASGSPNARNLRYTYPGIKEDVYIPFFKPGLKLRDELGVGADEILVTLRPPATEAHYHNPESETLFKAAVARLKDMDGVRMVILPRYDSQFKYIAKKWPREIKAGKIIIPAEALDGLSLLWNSDLVISGGGTMNREAAALRVPVYSIFRGKIGAVDRWLHEQGRLELIESVEDIHKKIKVEKREIKPSIEPSSNRALSVIVEHIERLIAETGK
jgi:hypothetical protein